MMRVQPNATPVARMEDMVSNEHKSQDERVAECITHLSSFAQEMGKTLDNESAQPADVIEEWSKGILRSSDKLVSSIDEDNQVMAELRRLAKDVRKLVSHPQHDTPQARQELADRARTLVPAPAPSAPRMG